jgi:RNA polymerase sigma factor (sigma-70 family)
VIEFSKLSDDALLREARRRPEAFGTFYERHAQVVLGYLLRTTGNYEVALDLTSEVFAAALEALDRYRPGEAPARAWVFGIVKNKLTEVRRGQARADAARRRLGIPRMAFDDAAIERVEEAIDAERTGCMEGLLDLTPEEREAINAHVIEERGYAELATSAGTSEAAIRKRVSRGLARLAQRWTGAV